MLNIQRKFLVDPNAETPDMNRIIGFKENHRELIIFYV